MILIYTHQITPRLRYIFKHVFTRILQIPVDFTLAIEEFIAYDGIKIAYTELPLGNSFFIRNHTLLFDKGVDDLEIKIEKWQDIPCFFSAGDKSTIPFDIFAASFYLISRYEEYIPHVKDNFGRFSSNQSIAYKFDFLEKPIVDIWAFKLLEVIKEKFPNHNYPERKYRFVSTIDVDNAYAYKHKGLVRTMAGFLNDLYRFKMGRFFNRFSVLFNIKKDPFFTFDKIINLQKQFDVETLFFFLVGDYTTFDTNISTSKNKFRFLIKQMVDYATVGLHPSYFTMEDVRLLEKEKKRLEEITNVPIRRSRQHYLRFSLPRTYQNLIDLEITEDYSMGYADRLGFRAGTCTPFYFYDLDFEIQTPLKVFPFALMDTTLNHYMKLSPEQSLEKITEIANQVKSVGGVFITLSHNESLSNHMAWKGWENNYKAILEIATQ